MQKLAKYQLTLFLWILCAPSAIGAGYTNLFDNPFDYVANGIIGDTNWDGVYLRGGDIVGGSIGGSGSGVQNVANTTAPFPGYLNLQNAGGDWSGADNDGFFIYKVVQGDFDVSVQSVPATLSGGIAFDNRGFNFAGLQIRAYHTNNSGAAYSTTVTNLNAENSYRLWRFHEFNIDGQIRRSTNGANGEFTYAPDTSAGTTNETRFYRIVRQNETNFFFYWKANAGDAWLQITNGATPGGVAVRSDWAGVNLQVGIAQAAFNAAARDAVIDDFELTGPNVTFPTLPTAPSNLVTTSTNTGGSLTFSWTVGTPGNGSFVVVRRGTNIQHNPVHGFTYVADPAFGNTNTLLGGANHHVVFSGLGSSVTVTNLGANNVPYYVAVYEYTGSGAATVYNTASPATGSFVGPGVITSAALAAAATDIPVNGATQLRMIASFSTGETSDQSANTAWGSGDLAVADVNATGIVTGITNGTALITGTFGPFVLSTNITVHTPVFVDNFAATNDYKNAGLVGSKYDGLYLNFGNVPGAVAGADGNGVTTVMDTQISNTNGLSITSLQSTWQGTGNDGPFLFKVVPGISNGVSGDFSAYIHVNTMNTLANSSVGLMARLFNPANGGAGPGNAENHVNYWKVQNGTTAIRRTQNGGNTTFVAAGPAAGNGWLLLSRVNSTNFYFFEKSAAVGNWTFVTNIVLAAASNNAPMQVGIAQETRSGVNGIAVLDSGFVLDAAGLDTGTPPPAPANNFLMTLNPNLSMTINYSVGTNLDGTAVQSMVVMRASGPVTAQPYAGIGLAGNSVFGNAANNLGGGNYVVYRSPAGSFNTNESVTVTGLTPGVTYYAAVYTFVGSGAGTTFNNNASTANGSLADGTLLDVAASLEGGIPAGGIGQLVVEGIYTGGARVNVSSTAVVTSADTNVIKVLGGVLTGVTNGTAAVSASFGGITNTISVTVRPPTFTDGFGANHDYLVGGVTGTEWDGLYDPNVITNPIPSSPYVPLAGSGATVADANITSNNVLTITSAGDGWENAAAGGFFLFKYVPGDFQMAVQINAFDVAAFNQPGLLARAYGVDTNGNFGAPFGTVVTNANGTNDLGEYWVSLSRFDEFGIGTYARRNLDSVVSQNTQPDPAPGDTNYWLLIARSQGTNFTFYKRLSSTDAWKRLPNNTSYQINQFAGQPMQVGLMAGAFSGANGAQRMVQFANFLLDVGKARLQIASSGGNALLTWVPASGVSLQYTLGLNPVNWQPISGTPVATNGALVTVSIPLTNTTSFFRLVQ